VLVPLADMINHRYSNDGDDSALCEWGLEAGPARGGGGGFVVRSFGEISAGTELSLSYGHLGAAGSLMSYGFTPNPPQKWEGSQYYEYVVLDLQLERLLTLAQGEPATEADTVRKSRVWRRDETATAFSPPLLPRARNSEEGVRQLLISNGDAEAGRALLSLLRCAVASPTELRDLLESSGESVEEVEDANEVGGGDGSELASARWLAREPLTARNELAAMQLLGELTSHQLSRYKESLAADLKLLERPASIPPNRLNAVRVVAGEKRVLNHLALLSHIAVRHLTDVGGYGGASNGSSGDVPLVDVELSGMSYRRLLGFLLGKADLDAWH
jgi:hypothetical protein